MVTGEIPRGQNDQCGVDKCKAGVSNCWWSVLGHICTGDRRDPVHLRQVLLTSYVHFDEKVQRELTYEKGVK